MFVSRFHLQIQEDDTGSFGAIIITSEAAYKQHNILNQDTFILDELSEPTSINGVFEILTYLNYYFLFKPKKTPLKKCIITLTNEFPDTELLASFSQNIFQHRDNTSSFIFFTLPLPDQPQKAVDSFPQLFAI